MATPTEQEQLTLAEVVDTDIVKCRFCKNLFKDPLLLPCLHTLCQECVVAIILSEECSFDGASGSAQEKGSQRLSTSETSSTAETPPDVVLASSDKNQQKVDTGTEDGDGLQPVDTSKPHKKSLKSTEGNTQVILKCPVCASTVTLTGSAVSPKDEDFDTFADSADVEMPNANPGQSRENGKGKGNVNDDLNKSIQLKNQHSNNNNLQTSKSKEKNKMAVRHIVKSSLPQNHFLKSVTQLRRYKRDAEKFCSYCREDGEFVPASCLCLECHDEMCKTCQKAHRKTRLTRDHTVATFSSIQQGLFDHDIRSHHQIHCVDHQSSAVTLFCLDCLQILCKSCRSRLHYDHNTVSLSQASEKLLPEIQQIEQAISRRVPSLVDYAGYLEGQILEVNNTKSRVTAQINTRVDLICKMIDSYRQEAIATLEQACEKEISSITQRVQDISLAAKSLEETAQFLLYLSSVGRCDEVLSLYGSVLSRHKQLVNCRPDGSSTLLSPVFTDGPATEQNVEILVGMLDLCRLPLDKKDIPQTRLSVANLMPKVLEHPLIVSAFKAVSPCDTSPVYPSGLALNNTMLVVVDRENARVKIFDHGGKFLKHFSGEEDCKLIKPFDAVWLQNGALAVTDSEAGQVRIFDWTGKFLTNFQGDIRHPRGITMNHKGEVIVLDGHLRHLTVHEAATGKMIRKIRPKFSETDGDIDKDNDDESIRNVVLIDPYYVTVDNEDNIVVTDMASPNLKILNNKGLVLAISMDYGTRKEESLHPSGICVDKFGQILVADTNNSRIHLGLPNGMMPGTLLKREDGISKPVSLAISNEGYLVLGQSGGEIRILRYL